MEMTNPARPIFPKKKIVDTILIALTLFLAASALVSVGAIAVRDFFCFDSQEMERILDEAELQKIPVLKNRTMATEISDSCTSSDFYAVASAYFTPPLNESEFDALKVQLSELKHWENSPWNGMSEKRFLIESKESACFHYGNDSSYAIAVENIQQNSDVDGQYLKVQIALPEDISRMTACHA